MDETLLKERFQEATRRPPEREGCPSSEELSRLAARAFDGSPRDAVLDHVTLCHECSVELRTALSLRDWSRDASGVGRRPDFWIWGLGAAAAAAVVLSLSILAPEEPTTPSSRYRDGGSGAVSSFVEEEAALPREDFLLRWSPAPRGSQYELRVMDEQLHIVYRARGLEASEHRVPPEALDGVSSGARLLWQVEVREPTGRRTTSPVFFVRVQ